MTPPSSEHDHSGDDPTKAVDASIPLKRQIGPYQLLARVGVGGMGEVFRARDSRLNRTVAIKLLPAHVANDAQARERFEWEARAIAALNHPHICTLYDVGTDGGVDFLVMEFVEGETLAGPLAIDTAIQLAVQIADALASAHQRGILHRDLKPSNIMRTKAGAKLLDFGLAKIIAGGTDERTAAGTIWGTVAYMSPEQAEGKTLDARSDIFSFGAVLYEIISGRRAFPGDSSATIVSALLRDAPPALDAAPALQQVVRRCLAKHPADRYRDFAEVKDALQRLGPALGEWPSIAILPLASLSTDPENEYFCDGISEEIINALTQIRQLRVAARTSSFAFKHKPVPISEVAAQLNVRHVLEGSVRRSGDRVRVTAQLVDASNGYQLWSERYDRQLEDIFDVQDQIARAIVDRLKVALVGEEPVRLVKVNTTDVEAYQHYVKGRVMLYRRGPWVGQALESFQTAVSIDPDYAQAWAGVAESYTALSYMGARRPDQAMPAALQAARRATRLDPDSPEGHNALALVALLWERDFERARSEFGEALRLNPQFTHARCLYGLFLLAFSLRLDAEALVETQRALDGDPLSSFASTIQSFCLVVAGRYDEGVSRARTAVQYDPQSFLAQWALGSAYTWSGHFGEALAAIEPLWNETKHTWAAMALVSAYTGAGRRERANAVFAMLLERQKRDYVPPIALAVCAAALGDVEAALGYCEAGVEMRDTTMGILLWWHPELDAVRADPRYRDIARRYDAR